MKKIHIHFFSSIWYHIRPYFGYCVSFIIIFAALFIGSQANNVSGGTRISMVDSIVNAGLSVNMDQMSETYFVTNIANSVNLPSVNALNENFVTISALYTATSSIDIGFDSAPNIIDTSNLVTGASIAYVVKSGDTIDSIAARHKVTAVNIRQSNNIKSSATPAVGTTIYIPSKPGILYTVKKSDSLDDIVARYKTNKDEVIAYNDLNTNEFREGLTLLLPSGELPEKETPDYVPPKPATPNPSYSSGGTTIKGAITRINFHTISWNVGDINGSRSQNTMAAGNCTWFAWYWRRAHMPSNYWLPTGRLGNAADWKRTLAGQFYINNTPAYGAVVETPGHPIYGHVGVVTAVHEDGSITIQEMNWNYRLWNVTQSEISATDARKLIYIHGHY
jgi:surface antigen/LysM repeat protein